MKHHSLINDERLPLPQEPWIMGGVYLARAQGAVFLVSGIWPVLHRRSFEAVTGPKADFWLVKTVGLLLAVIGAALARAGTRAAPTSETALVAAGSAAALAGIDLAYATSGRISRIYLLDAAMELGFVAAWLAWWRARRRSAAAGPGPARP